MNRIVPLFVLLMSLATFAQATTDYEKLTKDFVQGKADISSMSILTFGPEGLLFVGDSKAGKVFALDMNDRTPNPSEEGFELEDMETRLGNLLGTGPRGVIIHDMAVNPISQNVYLAVSRSDAKELGFWNQPNDITYATILLKVTATGEMSEVNLDNISHSVKKIDSVIEKGTLNWKKKDRRTSAITDIAFDNGQLYVTGLSNEEFSSALRIIAFPFDDKELNTSVEVWHVAHGKSETEAPIRTLLPYDIDGEKMILAAYTCTPFVTIPLSDVQGGAHVKSKTIAEFGFGNMPIDIIAYKNKGKEYLLMSNTAKALIRIDPMDISKEQHAITASLQEGEYALGVEHDVLSRVGVTQIDNLNAQQVLVLQRMPNGFLNLRTYSTEWL